MIPDIALMIVVYGVARLLVAVLEPHRRAAGTAGQVASGISWIVVVFAVIGLAVLGLMVIGSSASTPTL